jgi:hypothetical protein
MQPVAFHSLSPAEANYSMLDKELLAVAVALNNWRHHLEGCISGNSLSGKSHGF